MSSDKKIFQAIVNGVHEVGDGGVLYVKDGHCAYMLPEHFKDDGVAEFVRKVVTSEHANKVFFAMEHQADNTVRVRGYAREHVVQVASSE
jgi:hypothetical protein